MCAVDDDFETLRDLFLEALARPPSGRAEFLQRSCPDGQVAARVAKLLTWHDRAEPLDFATPIPDIVLGPVTGHVREAAKEWLATPVLPSLIPAGTALEDLEVLDRIGVGGTGQVYRARQRSVDRIVAVKVVDRRTMTAAAVQRFRAEAVVAAKLTHVNLVEVHWFGEDPSRGLLYYTMRFVSGHTLAAVIDARAGARVTSACETRAWIERAIEVARALATLHGAGLVHRDVKPSNVMLEVHAGRERAVLVDFGLVHAVESLGSNQTVRATLSYAAPETLSSARVTARADVFGLGVTLRDLLCGTPPTLGLAADRVRVPVRTMAPGIDRRLAAIIDRATSLVPAMRHADASELAEDLGAWLRGDRLVAGQRAESGARGGERWPLWRWRQRPSRRSRATSTRACASKRRRGRWPMWRPRRSPRGSFRIGSGVLQCGPRSGPRTPGHAKRSTRFSLTSRVRTSPRLRSAPRPTCSAIRPRRIRYSPPS